MENAKSSYSFAQCTLKFFHKIGPVAECWNLGMWEKPKLEVRQERPCGLMDKAKSRYPLSISIHKMGPVAECWNMERREKPILEVWQERPCGLMDKASVSDTGDCKFESCQGRQCLLLPIESKVEFVASFTWIERRVERFAKCKNTGPWESVCHWCDKIYSNVVVLSLHPVHSLWAAPPVS